MKRAVTIILIASFSFARAQQPPTFGLAGTVTIAKATCWMDGGSVTVQLRDDRGASLSVRYTNDWLFERDEHGGQFSVNALGSGRRYLTRAGRDERELLQLLRIASMETFRTTDPERLVQRQPGTHLDFDRMATGSLFQQAGRRPAKKQASKRK